MAIGVGLGCCCGCTWQVDAFGRADTSGTSSSRLGATWTVASGDWQISGGQLTVSAAGSVLTCTLTAPNPQFKVAIAGTVPAGAVLRIYPNTTNSGNHVRFTPNSAGGPPYNGRVRVVATQTADIENLNVPTSGTFTMCRSKNVAGNWILGADVPHYPDGNVVGAFCATPTVNTYTIEVVSTPSPITIAGITAVTTGTANCPPGCDSACPVFCENAQFVLTISGWTDAPAGYGTAGGGYYPAATCSCINGSYTFDNTDSGGLLGTCSWAQASPAGCADAYVFGPNPPSFSISYLASTNKTYLTFFGYGGFEVDGQLDCVNGFTLTFTSAIAAQCSWGGDGGPPYSLSYQTFKLTCLGGG
jgi:hypothetical protein